MKTIMRTGGGDSESNPVVTVAGALHALKTILIFFVFLALGCSTKNWTATDWYGQSSKLASQGKHGEAITALTRAIELDPSQALAYQNRGYEHAQIGNYCQALDDFNKVLTLHDKRVPPRDTYREIGAVYFKMGKFEDAVAAWQKSIGKVKDDPGLLNDLAVAYLNLGQIERAGHAALSAYSIDPSLPDVLNTMGEIALARKEYKQAGEYFVKAIERGLSPFHSPQPSPYWNAALAFEKTKQYDKAIEYAEQYMKRVQDPAGRQKAYELVEKLKKEMAR